MLGRIDEPGVDTQIIIRKFNIPDTHSAEAIEEARRLGGAVKDRDIRGRTDFRGVTTVTIDGEHARDFDCNNQPMVIGKRSRAIALATP